jgi:hypothetical protein
VCDMCVVSYCSTTAKTPFAFQLNINHNKKVNNFTWGVFDKSVSDYTKTVKKYFNLFILLIKRDE